MKFFWLNRLRDVSGTSGVGIVAEGVQFSNGTCAITWKSRIKTVCIFQSLQEVEAIHGHDGATEIVYDLPRD